MKVKFKTGELEYYYLTPLDEIKGKQKFQKEIILQFKKKVQLLINVRNIDELRLFKSLNFEMLKGDLAGNYSIRLNLQYRLIFNIEKKTSEEAVVNVAVVNEISKHYE